MVCETTDSTSSPFIGILLTLIACCNYALGNCLQRYALLRPEGETVDFRLPPISGTLRLHRHLAWLLGATIYFSANGFYAVALSFAPVSVLSAVFALTIVTNAGCSWYFMGDQVPKRAYPGYVLVLLGAVLFAAAVTVPVCHYGGEELVEVILAPGALVFWGLCVAFMVYGGVFAWQFEKKHVWSPDDEMSTSSPRVFREEGGEQAVLSTTAIEVQGVGGSRNPPKSAPSAKKVEPPPEQATNENSGSADRELLHARLLYPAALGTTEAVGALVLKAVNSLATSSVDEGHLSKNDDFDAAGLWVCLFVIGFFLFLMIIGWLRLVYRRFEISGAFPVEFGMLTFLTVVGGFAVFQDWRYVQGGWTSWCAVVLAGCAIVGGVLVVAVASWQEKVSTTGDSWGESKEEGQKRRSVVDEAVHCSQ